MYFSFCESLWEYLSLMYVSNIYDYFEILLNYKVLENNGTKVFTPRCKL